MLVRRSHDITLQSHMVKSGTSSYHPVKLTLLTPRFEFKKKDITLVSIFIYLTFLKPNYNNASPN